MKNKGEKRRHRRISCKARLESKAGSVFDHSQTIDISQGGVGILAATNIPLNQEIAVEIDLMPGVEPVIMRGQVKWVTPVRNAQGFRAGLQFKKVLFAGSRVRLNQYFPPE